MVDTKSYVVEMVVPVSEFGGIGSINSTPHTKARTITVVYKWYIFPANCGMDYATYHLLWEPKTTIDSGQNAPSRYWQAAAKASTDGLTEIPISRRFDWLEGSPPKDSLRKENPVISRKSKLVIFFNLARYIYRWWFSRCFFQKKWIQTEWCFDGRS